MASRDELRQAESKADKLRDEVRDLENELTVLKTTYATSTTQLTAATQALSAIRILTQNETGIADAVHTLATNWRDF